MSQEERIAKLEVQVAALERLLLEFLGAEAEEDQKRAQHERYRQRVRERRAG